MDIKMSYFPHPKMHIENAQNGSFLIITDRKLIVKRIINTLPYEVDTCITTFGARLHINSEASKAIDILEILKKEEISLSMICKAKYCIFVGEIVDSIFTTDITMLYCGCVIGQPIE